MKIKRTVIDIFKTLRLFKYYNLKSSNIVFQKETISMIDGRTLHGGLGDRISGIVSAYIYAKSVGRKFFINHYYPFNLEDFLKPNKFDWRINRNDISYNIFVARPFYISICNKNPCSQYKYFKSRLSDNIFQQHIYTNCVLSNRKNFSIAFNELFKPSDEINRYISEYKDKIGIKYVSITFRFQQLLGDFNEKGFRTLNNRDDVSNLLERCREALEFLYSKEKTKILVTSDSKTFLNYISNKFDYVFLIPGDVVHCDYVTKDKQSNSNYLKSFLDLYMIANAEKIYRVKIKPLYGSCFPIVASNIFNKGFLDIELYNDDFIIIDRRDE